MKTKMILAGAAIAAVLGLSSAQQPGGGRNIAQHEHDISSQLVETAVLSNNEKEMLLYMKDEEKMARDLYNAFSEKWGRSNFRNIAASEQNHIDEITAVLEHYDITSEAGEAGKFDNREIQKLYDSYLAAGSESLTAALKTAALVEDLDISDLTKYTGQTTNENLVLVFGNLRQGSENHLRAFTRQLASLGEEYQPQHISAAEYEAIIAGSTRGYSTADAGRGQGMMQNRRNADNYGNGRGMMQPGRNMTGDTTVMGRGGMMNRQMMRSDSLYQHRMLSDSLYQHRMLNDSAFMLQRMMMRNDSTFNRGNGRNDNFRNTPNNGRGNMRMNNQFRDNNNTRNTRNTQSTYIETRRTFRL